MKSLDSVRKSCNNTLRITLKLKKAKEFFQGWTVGVLINARARAAWPPRPRSWQNSWPGGFCFVLDQGKDPHLSCRLDSRLEASPRGKCFPISASFLLSCALRDSISTFFILRCTLEMDAVDHIYWFPRFKVAIEEGRGRRRLHFWLFSDQVVVGWLCPNQVPRALRKPSALPPWVPGTAPSLFTLQPRYAHLHWGTVLPLLVACWSHSFENGFLVKIYLFSSIFTEKERIY